MARLGDIFIITSGGTPDKKKSEYYANGTIPWVKTGDLKNQYVPTGIECITEEGLNNSSAKLFPPNTVLVAMYGATIGACSILPYEASTNQACAAFLPNEKVLPTYLYYFLSSKKELFIKDGVGGAQPNISAGYLKNVQFDLIPMQQQINMVSTLDKVSELIALRKEQLAKLDRLVKSRFIELFGDPVASKKKRKLAEIGKVFTGNTPPMKEPSYYESNDIPFIKPSDLSESGVTNIDGVEAFISEKARPAVRIIPPNAVLVTCIGTIGKIGITARESCCNQQINFIVPNDDINSAYLAYCLTFFKNTLLNMANAPVVPIINKTQFSDLEIPVFDIEQQKQFAAFVAQTDKSKLVIQQSLDKLELLKKSLMQEYFG